MGIATFKPPLTTQNPTHEEKPQRIFLRVNTKQIQVELGDILFVEASGNYIKIVLKEETITLRGSLSSLDEHLPTEGFIQVHPSFTVAKKHIRSIEGNQIVIGQYTVPIGKLFKEKVDRLLI